MWGLRAWSGDRQWKKWFSFCRSRDKFSGTDASFVRLTHGCGMEMLCGVERLNRRVHCRRQEVNKESLHTHKCTQLKVQHFKLRTEEQRCDAWHGGTLVWVWEDADTYTHPTGKDCRTHFDCPTLRTVGPQRCHLQTMWHRPCGVTPLHNVTKTSAQPQARTECVCVDSTRRSSSLHHFTLQDPPLLLPPPPTPHFSLSALQALTAQFVTRGFLPGSHPDIRRASLLRPWLRCPQPDVVWSTNRRNTVWHVSLVNRSRTGHVDAGLLHVRLQWSAGLCNCDHWGKRKGRQRAALL